MQALLSNRYVIVMIAVISYLATSVVLLLSQRWMTHPAHTGDFVPKPYAGPSWSYINPELDQMLAELRRERESLSQREQQLNDLAVRLQAERQEINQVTQTVHRMQMELENLVLKVKEEEAPNLKKLAKLYSSMTPEGAAGIVRELPDDSIVKIFTTMREAEVAPILEQLAKTSPIEAKRAALLTERLRSVLPKPAVPAKGQP